MSAECGQMNDNVEPKVDSKLVVATTSGYADQDSTVISAKTNDLNDDDDYFVCRKCDKVFKDLSEYLEHKIRDENYRISHTRSKANKRLVIPHLVEKKKKAGIRIKGSVAENESERATAKSNFDTEKLSPQDSIITNTQESKDKLVRDLEETPTDNSVKKRGRKRNLNIQNEQETEVTEKGNACHLCDRKFRRTSSCRQEVYQFISKVDPLYISSNRAATLRWHLTYDHKSKEDDSDVSDSSEYDVSKDNISNNDEDFTLAADVQEQENDHDLDNVKKNTLSQLTTQSVTAKGKKSFLKTELPKTRDSNARPFVCEICGQGFKELPVYKAHAIVHSQERKYICTVDGCPYGFKTKGCLVRHMRRHTGDRPFECEKCGRSFTESGALSRHLKARRNCALLPDTHYPRYKKKWSYHPNIEAVVDKTQREAITMIQPLEMPYILTSNNLVLSEAADSYTFEKLEIEGSEEVISSATEQVAFLPANNGDDNASGIRKSNDPSTISTSFPVKSETRVDNAEDEMAELKRNSDRTCLKETQCHVCKKDFLHNKHLEVHLHCHLEYQPTQCGFCHFLATSREEMHQHVLSLHAESLSDTESFIFAMQGEDSKKDMHDQDRKATLSLREALIAVKQLYGLKAKKGSESGTINPSTTGTLKCLVCSKTFKGMNYMRQHMRMHTGDRPFKCDHCNNRFTSRDVLKKHMYVHMDQRDFKCGECGKMFKRLAHVQQHLRIHSRQRDYICTICEKLFKTHNSLKVHLRTHTNINPYKCQMCNRHFRERGSLQRHMRLHTGEKPFACPHCNRHFAEHGTLSRHLKAKVPCSVTRDADIQPATSNTTMLAQFSSVVADTQEYILPTVQEEEISGDFVVLKNAENGNSEIVENIEIFTEESLPENKETTFQFVSGIGSDTTIDQVPDDSMETLQIYDASTGESLLITGDKSVIELVKSKQVTLETTEGFGLDKLQEMLLASDKQTPSVDDLDGGKSDQAQEEIVLKFEEDVKGVEKKDTHSEEDQKTLLTKVISMENVVEI